MSKSGKNSLQSPSNLCLSSYPWLQTAQSQWFDVFDARVEQGLHEMMELETFKVSVVRQ